MKIILRVVRAILTYPARVQFEMIRAIEHSSDNEGGIGFGDLRGLVGVLMLIVVIMAGLRLI